MTSHGVDGAALAAAIGTTLVLGTGAVALGIFIQRKKIRPHVNPSNVRVPTRFKLYFLGYLATLLIAGAATWAESGSVLAGGAAILGTMLLLQFTSLVWRARLSANAAARERAERHKG